LFATTVAGLGPILADEIGEIPGATVTGLGADGRSALVMFDVDGARAGRALGLRIAEDVFVAVDRTSLADADAARRVARRAWPPERVGPALSRWTRLAVRRGGSAPLTYRVVVRLRGERSLRRTELRRELVRAVGQDRPRWRPGDPSQLEIWVLEYRHGRLVTGLRASDARMRQHGGRRAERPGALRPVVAAAMVRSAGRPGLSLLDPCCGSGSILAEAVRSGWTAHGADIDAAAVRVARRNVPDAGLDVGDARRLDRPDGSVDACVSNLPFGRRYAVEGDRAGWLRRVLSEMARVTRPGGRVVVLVPDVPAAAVPATLRRSSTHRLRLLGTSTAMWCYDVSADTTS
jgi:23S rRNA G2445 N2-methylase RlmL